MRTRVLGGTGLQVSELTLGTASLKQAGVDAARYALERGVNAIELEGASAAESLIAELLKRGSLQDAHIFSRVPSLVRFDLPSPHIPAFRAYPGDHIRAVTEASLKRLDVERLACQMIHAWCPEWLGEGDWLESMVALREEGKIAAIGVSLFDHDLHSAAGIVASGAIQCIQLMFNIFDQGASAGLLKLCQRHDVGVIARSPLYFGALAPAIHAPKPFADWRDGYFFDEHLEETRRRVTALDRDLDDLPGTALRFALSHPAVSTVVVGMTSADHVEANMRAVELGPLDTETIQSLRAHRWLC